MYMYVGTNVHMTTLDGLIQYPGLFFDKRLVMIGY